MARPFNTLLGALSHHAGLTPDKVAVIEGAGGKSVTYGAFWEQICAYASFLKEHGLEKGDRVALLTAQTIDYLSAYYGVMLAGGVAVPVEPMVTEKRLAEISDYFEAKFTASAKLENTLKFDGQPQERHRFSLPEDDSELAVILYTTGTTGRSKGVLSSHRSRFCGADNVSRYYDMTEGDTALVPQLLSHSGGLRRVEAMFVSGATVVIMGASMFLGDIFKALKLYDCTILQLVPAQVAQMLRSAERMLVAANDQLRVLAVGSAAIPESHKEKLREILPGVRLFNDFGSTEAIGSAYFEWSAHPPKAGCIGTAAAHSTLLFLDEAGNELGETSRQNTGIIAIEGSTLMSGYWNEPDLTASVLKDGRFISADLGYRGDDGMIYVSGRKTDVIVSGANKISPLELEDAALRIGGIRECAALGRTDEIMGQLPVLFVVGEGLTAAAIIAELGNSLEHYKVPKPENVIFVDALPKSAGTGKVIKKQLEAML